MCAYFSNYGILKGIQLAELLTFKVNKFTATDIPWAHLWFPVRLPL